MAAQRHGVEGFVALSFCPTLVEAHGLEMPQTWPCLLTFLFACGVVCAMLPGGRRPPRPVAGSGGHIFIFGWRLPQNVAGLIPGYTPYGISAQIENEVLDLELGTHGSTCAFRRPFLLPSQQDTNCIIQARNLVPKEHELKVEGYLSKSLLGFRYSN